MVQAFRGRFGEVGEQKISLSKEVKKNEGWRTCGEAKVCLLTTKFEFWRAMKPIQGLIVLILRY